MDLVSDVASGAADALGAIWDTAVEIARAVDGHVSFDGMTIVIDVPEFDPCPDLDFSLRLSDLGLDPHLYFPIGGGAFTFGIVTVLGVLGVEANLDPGIGIALEDCNFGPAQIRISPLSQEATVSGMLSVTTTSMVQLGADLGLRADVTAIIAVPSAPPIVLVVPVMGVALGGAMEFMLQSRATISSAMTATMGIGGISAAYNIGAEVGYGLDLSYGLYGSLSILGLDLCRVGWPVDRIHKELGVNLNLAAALSLGTGGLDFSYAFSATPITANPLEDLNFAFDDSRLEDECWLCEFMSDNGLLPGQNDYNWANPTYQASLPRLGGPRGDIMARQPDPSKDAKCRGTCGVDCAEQSCDKEQYDLIRCENVADHHIWHTYVNYATCGAHQGCMDHDACYDMAADMPVWGFGGMMIGPMFRACDLGAMCGYSFQQGVTWAMGGGPYDRRLAYADERRVKRGCLGGCPENVAPEGEAEIQQTCLDDRELWQGTEVGDQWGFDFGRVNLFQGFVTVPWIVGVHYGVDASARIDADASAQLGPINLENACLIYDPATMTYTGTADLSLFLNGRASASITAALDGWLSDFLCLFNVIDLRGTLNAGATVQFPTFLTAGVDLYCADGNLEIRPKASIEACLDIFGEIRAALDVFVGPFNVWGQEWPLIQKQIEKCWKMQISFEPFIVGQAPSFDLLSSGLDYFGLITDLFEPARHVEIDRTPARNPLPGARLLFPCIGDDDGDDDADTPPDCSNKATVAQALAHTSVADRTPRWGSTDTITIPDGSAAEAGTSMEVKYLTSDLDGGSPPSVQAAIYRRVGLPTSGCLNKGYKAHHEFIRGHLLNENVGGPGDQENNLFPITGKANRDHKTQVEQGGLNVVGKVGQGDVVYYKVTIQGASSPRPIAHPTTGVTEGFYEISSTLHCEVADYNFCNDNTLHRNPLRTVDVPSQFVFGTGGDAFDTKVKHPYCSR